MSIWSPIRKHINYYFQAFSSAHLHIYMSAILWWNFKVMVCWSTVIVMLDMFRWQKGLLHFSSVHVSDGNLFSFFNILVTWFLWNMQTKWSALFLWLQAQYKLKLFSVHMNSRHINFTIGHTCNRVRVWKVKAWFINHIHMERFHTYTNIFVI
jgi:hypothetical protein